MSCDDPIFSRFIAGVAKLKALINLIKFSGRRSDLKSQERSDLGEENFEAKKRYEQLYFGEEN